jgi:Zn-dependent protease
MKSSLRLGTAFGIGIYVHWSFLLLPAWLLLTTWGIVGTETIVYMLTLLAAIFGCVILHELGHALMARHFGIRTRDITLYPIGGVARLERMSERPLEELLIAVAGPAVNVVIALGLVFVLGVSGSVFRWEALIHSVPGGFLAGLLAANVMLVAFNLLPAFPMDGGRVLRALLSIPLGRLRATEIAAHVAVVVAVLLGLVGLLWLNNPMLVLVAGFVFLAGRQELTVVRRQEALRRAEPIDVLPADPAIISPTPPPVVGLGFTGAVWDAQRRVWVLWHNGRRLASYGVGPE